MLLNPEIEAWMASDSFRGAVDRALEHVAAAYPGWEVGEPLTWTLVGWLTPSGHRDSFCAVETRLLPKSIRDGSTMYLRIYQRMGRCGIEITQRVELLK